MEKVKVKCIAQWFGVVDASHLADAEYADLSATQKETQGEPWASIKCLVDGRIVRILSGHHAFTGDLEIPKEGIIKVADKRIVAFVPLADQIADQKDKKKDKRKKERG